MPSFVPEHFAVLRAADTSTYKRFKRGVEQLDAEGVVQVLRNGRRGEQAPVLAAVGPMQFEVARARLDAEFGVTTGLEHLSYEVARRTDRAGEERLRGADGVEVFTRVRDGALLALFTNGWRMRAISDRHHGLTLDPLLVAG
ncbi:hypothetical protein [Micromonospora sp. NPDC005367]|uniref:hypothetical protein n=1 Tax=Micromonospora sp. NPDC005367 TaxID=3155590 RepID=UPI0033B131CE